MSDEQDIINANLNELFKGGLLTLEIMQKINTLVVDKTGTLTEGKPQLVSIIALEGFQEQDILRLSASLERAS